MAGPLLHLRILSHKSITDALAGIVSNQLADDLVVSTEMIQIFKTFLTEEDKRNIGLDVMAAAMRSPSVGTALNAVSFNRGQSKIKVYQFRRLYFNQACPNDSSYGDTFYVGASSILGLHALMAYRVSHRLWENGRRSLAKYFQSRISATFSADIHPAAKLGGGNLLNCGAGVVIGETAVTGYDVSIMQGVTLGGTGKEIGNRHPKIGNGVTLQVR